MFRKGGGRAWCSKPGRITADLQDRAAVPLVLAAHKGVMVKELIESRVCTLLYLPPYSPDYNPIEGAFSKIKGLLREAEARTRETLVEAISRALSAVTARDTRGFFEHCGYHPPGQLL